MNMTEEELARILAQGNATLDVEHSDARFSASKIPRPGKLPAARSSARRTVAPRDDDDPSMLVPDAYTTRPGVSFQSKTERRSLTYLLTFEPDVLLYEPVGLRVMSGTYTPDWLMVKHGVRVYVEIKGAARFKAYKSGRGQKKALWEAARQYAFDAVFVLAVYTGQAWTLELVEDLL